MSMNRYLSALLSLFLLLSFLACHRETNSIDSSENTSQSTCTSTQTVTTDPILQETPAEEFEYRVRDNSVVYIREYIGNDTHVVIPEQIEGFPVSVIVASAFAENDTLVSVIMPDTITEIWDYAFANCSSLETVVMSKNVTKILNHAFYECTNLSSITLPETLAEIGSSAFEKCSSLKCITIPASLTEWGYGVFYASGIELVNFQEGLKVIGEAAFANTRINELILPSTLVSIDYMAFAFCDNLTSVTLNDGLIALYATSFGYNKNLIEIVIPASVEIIDRPFVECDHLKKVFFKGNLPRIARFESSSSFTVYYHEDAVGFPPEEWHEKIPTAVW